MGTGIRFTSWDTYEKLIIHWKLVEIWFLQKELYWLWLIIYSPDFEATVWSWERANNVGNEMKNFIVFLKQFLTLEKRFKPIPNVCDSNVSALFLVLWIDLLCCRLDFVVLFNTSDWIMETSLMNSFYTIRVRSATATFFDFISVKSLVLQDEM